MITADQIIAHLIGDYIIQQNWMAKRKTSESFPAAVHAVTYTLPFAFLTENIAALAIIAGTHFVIDRFRLARWLIWLKEGDVFLGKLPTATGYPEDTPIWLSTWLMIIADNTMHLLCNGLALRFF